MEFPCAAILVNTGGEQNSDFDSTEALISYLDDLFVRRSDLNGRLTSLILTHPHIDHTRGVKAVIETYKPENAVTNGQEYGSGKAGQIRLHKYVKKSEENNNPSDDIPLVAVSKDDFTGTNGLTNKIVDPVICNDVNPIITALWGRVKADPGWGKEKNGKLKFINNNNHSVVLRIDFGKSSLLIPGDLEEVAIKDILDRYNGSAMFDVDVYDVGHHGSENGTTEDLLKAIAPEISIISMGPYDREDSWTAWQYGHPRENTVALLEKYTSNSRPPVDEMVATGSKHFKQVNIDKAIYAIGWDGDIVLEASTDGQWRILKPSLDTSRLNINTACVEQLIELPGMGQTKAKAIVEYRTKNGLFNNINQLDNVPGIGPAIIVTIEPLITIGE